jgi:hypothetical protein
MGCAEEDAEEGEEVEEAEEVVVVEGEVGEVEEAEMVAGVGEGEGEGEGDGEEGVAGEEAVLKKLEKRDVQLRHEEDGEEKRDLWAVDEEIALDRANRLIFPQIGKENLLQKKKYRNVERDRRRWEERGRCCCSDFPFRTLKNSCQILLIHLQPPLPSRSPTNYHILL